jgi:hypothetical protein
MVGGMKDRIIELANRDLDGDLSGPERAEFNRLLLADPAVRGIRSELARTGAALDGIKSLEVPADLHESIMAALPPQPIAAGREPHRLVFLRRPTWRYAASFAGGLLASALVFQLGLVRQDGLDSHELAGTIASVASDPSRVDVDLPGVKGAITLEGTAAAPVVQTHLAASRPIEVVASSQGRSVRLAGFVAPQDAPVEMSAGFGAGVDAAAPIDVLVIDATTGAVLQTARLHSSVPNRNN